MQDLFTAEQIEQFTADINQQLQSLTASDPVAQRGGRGAHPRAEKQRKAIEQATGQDATTFRVRFRQAARHDLCEKGGILHGQWTKYCDLVSKDMLNTFGSILVGLGLSGSALQVAVVAVATYVLYIGVQAFCAGDE
jgi:hypothetical protein